MGVVIASTATDAWAQAEATPGEEPSALKPWIAVLVFTGLVLAIAFKNPKRTHQG